MTSGVARELDERVRHLDIDLLQYGAKCRCPQAWIEIKPYEVADTEWSIVRRLASFFGCHALLVIEYDDQIWGVKPFRDGIIGETDWGGRQALLAALERARDEHECPAKDTPQGYHPWGVRARVPTPLPVS